MEIYVGCSEVMKEGAVGLALGAGAVRRSFTEEVTIELKAREQAEKGNRS